MIALKFKSKGTLAGSVVVGIALAYFLLAPAIKNFGSIQRTLALAKDQNQELKQASSDLQTFLDKYQSLSESDKVEIASFALPSTHPNTPVLLGSLEELAKLSGLTLISMSVDENPEKDKTAPQLSLAELQIQLSVSGSYPAFKDYLLRLENHLRLIDLQEMNFKVEEGTNATYQLLLKAYYQK